MIESQEFNPSRRRFLQAGAGAALTAAATPSTAAPARRPNFLFIIVDQLSLDALSAHGNRYAHIPNIERLISRGVTFLESHSVNPVCSPARSCLLTGRMPVETGVITNGRPILQGMPNMGHWFRDHGYRAVYCGKWHLPHGWTPNDLPGFSVLPTGGAGQGDIMDQWIARAGEAFLHQQSHREPFLLVTSFLEPHDICYWSIMHRFLVPPHPVVEPPPGRLPPLPPNNKVRPRAPAKLDQIRFTAFNDDQWRYYLYIYNRMVEMMDADVGRLLRALEDSGHAGNTVVVFTSDHGEGGGRHSLVQKWYPYQESVKVPLVVSCPGRIAEGVVDRDHLVNSADVISTFCDYAGISTPPHARGRSLRPLLERRSVPWREFTVSEHHIIGRMVRTADFKFVRYHGDPVEQLFDMRHDPWETKNLYDDARFADVVRDHRKLLDEWEARMIPAPNSKT